VYLIISNAVIVVVIFVLRVIATKQLLTLNESVYTEQLLCTCLMLIGPFKAITLV